MTRDHRILVPALLTLVLGAAACSPTIASAEGSVSEYRDRFVQRLAAEMPEVKARIVDADTVELIWPGGEKTEIDVAPSYEAWSQAPGERDHLLGRLVAGAKEKGPDGLPPRADRLVAVVRSNTLLADLGRDAGRLLTQPVAGDLIKVLAIDGDHVLRYATSEDLAALDLSEPEAWRVAGENLPKRIGPLRIEEIQGTGVLGVSAESGLAASLILNPKACGPEAPQGEDGQLIQLVDREFLALASRALPETFPAFWEFNAIVEKAGDGYSHTPITCRGGRWTVVSPPKG